MTSTQKSVAFCVTEISSRIDRVFCHFYLTCASSPRTISVASPSSHSITVEEDVDKLGMVIMLFCSRENDEGATVTQYLGSSVLDFYATELGTYRPRLMDCSTRPPVETGTCTIQIRKIPRLNKPLVFQTRNIPSQMFDAAESNLKWISPFHSRGLPAVTAGLKMVHSPYYVNHMGITLPSGAFCMMETCENNREAALRSHRQRLQVSLKRNHISEYDFVRIVADMMTRGVRSKHMRCLTVVADALTLHARVDIEYTPDIIMDKHELRGTERWEIPREPSLSGAISFTGDCEDFAREVYQQVKEITKWVTPRVHGDIIESMSAVLNMYVPTIEQGAVDSEAVSSYQRKLVPHATYRNHIWAALHPRHAFTIKCKPVIRPDYRQWPKQECEPKLPMIHLEGTSDVFPIVTHRTPGYIARIHRKKNEVLEAYPELAVLRTPDYALQTQHKSEFYKYAIACMTDKFAELGILDFTYTTGHKYGVSIYDWARGNYKFRPSTKHSEDRMQDIREMMSFERPVEGIQSKNKCMKSNVPDSVDCLRFGSLAPIRVPDGAKQAVYKIGDKTLYEIYFDVGFNSISSESE